MHRDGTPLPSSRSLRYRFTSVQFATHHSCHPLLLSSHPIVLRRSSVYSNCCNVCNLRRQSPKKGITPAIQSSATRSPPSEIGSGQSSDSQRDHARHIDDPAVPSLNRTGSQVQRFAQQLDVDLRHAQWHAPAPHVLQRGVTFRHPTFRLGS